MCFSPGSEVKVRSKGSPNGIPPALTWGAPPGTCQDPSQALLTCFFPLQFSIAFQDKDFKVTMPDGHVLTFPNRLGHDHLSYLSMEGLQISSFKLE